ncbi:MAG: phospholipase D-like domain-containing protein [Janthinobacterium lividum]
MISNNDGCGWPHGLCAARDLLLASGSGGENTTAILLAAGIEVRVKGARDLMHLKSYAVDGRLLRSGSANWSPTGLKRQDNDVLYEQKRPIQSLRLPPRAG